MMADIGVQVSPLFLGATLLTWHVLRVVYSLDISREWIAPFNPIMKY
jgi:hypothetical protein